MNLTMTKMKLGELSLYEQRGIFYKGNVLDIPDPWRDVEIMRDPLYLAGFDEGDDLGLTDADLHHAIIPVEVDGSTTYITGAYKDAGDIEGEYTVKIWLLIEEEPIPISES